MERAASLHHYPISQPDKVGAAARVGRDQRCVRIVRRKLSQARFAEGNFLT
jgi:hypothetical protein